MTVNCVRKILHTQHWHRGDDFEHENSITDIVHILRKLSYNALLLCKIEHAVLHVDRY